MIEKENKVEEAKIIINQMRSGLNTIAITFAELNLQLNRVKKIFDELGYVIEIDRNIIDKVEKKPKTNIILIGSICLILLTIILSILILFRYGH